MTDLEAFLASASVDQAVFALRPDYRALLIGVSRLPRSASTGGGPIDAAADELLLGAETVARELLAENPVEQLPHVAAWRDAYRQFGAKPQRTRNSLEALLRRAESGMPRVNPLTDIYNAIGVLHQVPIGGEDLSAYVGPPRLGRATGSEPFDTMANGAVAVERPEPGEVIWCDDGGVTCRRWNWRQGRRTQLTPATTSALFILDALSPMTDEALTAAGDELIDRLRGLEPELSVAVRVLGAGNVRLPS